MSFVHKNWVLRNPHGSSFSGRFRRAYINDPIRFQHRPGSNFLCQFECACDNVWFYSRTYNKLRAPQVYRLVRLRFISLISDVTGCFGPGLVNIIPLCCKLLYWPFRSARTVGVNLLVSRVRVHRRVGWCVLAPFVLSEINGTSVEMGNTSFSVAQDWRIIQ